MADSFSQKQSLLSHWFPHISASEAETSNRNFASWFYLLCLVFHGKLFFLSFLFQLCPCSSSYLFYRCHLVLVTLHVNSSFLLQYTLQFPRVKCFFVIPFKSFNQQKKTNTTTIVKNNLLLFHLKLSLPLFLIFPVKNSRFCLLIPEAYITT